VAAILRQRNIPFAVIGAAAMALYGVIRSTRDIDILIVDPAGLDHALWSSVERGDATGGSVTWWSARGHG
jgi:hypothetical protein